MTGSPSIAQLLEAFLIQRRSELSVQAYGGYTTVVDLLRGSLNRFAYVSLTGVDRVRWEESFDAGDVEAYCNLFGPAELIEGLRPFREEHLMRRIRASELILGLADQVTDDLVGWMRERGYTGVPGTPQAARGPLPLSPN